MQIDVQDGVGPAKGFEPCRKFTRRLLLAKRQIVAEGREPCGVMHVPRVVPPQLAVQGIAVGVFLGNEGKAGALLLQLHCGAQRAHDAPRFRSRAGRR